MEPLKKQNFLHMAHHLFKQNFIIIIKTFDEYQEMISVCADDIII
jgi:hypothetical protein